MKPLAGLRIAVTRTATQCEELARELRRLGAEPVLFPLIEVLPPEDWSRVDAAIDALADYDWLVFTSANAVRFFVHRLREHRVDAADTKIAAIGPATADVLRECSVAPDVIPEQHTAESLAESMQGQGIAGAHVLLPQGDLARDLLARELRAAGARVDAVVCYRNVPARPDATSFLANIMRGEVDWILLFSPSAVHNLFALLHGDWCTHTRLASIGPSTTCAIREHGHSPAVEAVLQSTEALLRAVADDDKETR